MTFFFAMQNHKCTCDLTYFKLDTAYLSHFLFFIGRHMNTTRRILTALTFFCFMVYISLSCCTLISVVGYRSCMYTKCEK
jgi:hypothetical protein